jgi:hypothetical protein
MTTFSQDELDELSALVGGDGPSVWWSYKDGIAELTVLLDTYSGELPTSRARAAFHTDNYYAPKTNSMTGAYCDISYPTPFARDTDVANLVLRTSEVLRLCMGDVTNLTPDLMRVRAGAVDYYSTLEGEAPPPRSYAELALFEKRCREPLEEMTAVINEVKPNPQRHRNALALIEAAHADNAKAEAGANGSYQNHVYVDYPAGMGADLPKGVAFHVGDLLRRLAADVAMTEPGRAAELAAIASYYYPDNDLEIEIRVPNAAAFWLVDFDLIDLVEVRRIMAEDALQFLPGSLTLAPFSDQSRYDATSEAGTFRLAPYFEEYDDGDPEELCLVVGDHLAYKAQISRL